MSRQSASERLPDFYSRSHSTVRTHRAQCEPGPSGLTHTCVHTHTPCDLCRARSGLHRRWPPAPLECVATGAEPSGLRERAAGAWCSQTLRPKLRVCPPLPRGPAGLGAPCQLCKYFGETKVGLPRLKKGNESSWLGSFLHPFEQGWATPAGRRLDPIPPVSGADLLQVDPRVRTTDGKCGREGPISLRGPRRYTARPKERTAFSSS